MIRCRTSVILRMVALSCFFMLSACSESKDNKQKESAVTPAPPAIAKQETPVSPVVQKAATPAQEKKTDEPALPAKAKETPAPSTAKETAGEAKTKESALASKPPETAPPPSKKEEVATAKEPAAAAPLSLKMNIIGQRKEADGSYTEVLVSEGSMMRSRDNFQIHFQVNRPAHVYILMYDSEGKAGQIYPEAKSGQSAAVQANKKLVLPSNDLWFWLDDNAGTETIYVLASETPMTDISGLLSKMEGGNDSGQKLASRQIKEKITVMQRGVGGISKGDAVTYTLSDGKKIQKVTDIVTGTGSVVRAVSFQHR